MFVVVKQDRDGAVDVIIADNVEIDPKRGWVMWTKNMTTGSFSIQYCLVTREIDGTPTTPIESQRKAVIAQWLDDQLAKVNYDDFPEDAELTENSIRNVRALL